MATNYNHVVDLSEFIDYTSWKAEKLFITSSQSYPVDSVRLTQIIKAAYLDTLNQYNRGLGIPPSYAETVVSSNLRSLITISETFSPISNLNQFENFIDANIYIPIEHDISKIMEGVSLVSVVSHPNSNIYILNLSKA